MMPVLNRRLFLSAAIIGSASLAGIRPGRAQTRNVMDTLAADGRFDRFIEIITLAGATDQLRATAGVTIFAPVNEAFTKASQRITDLTGTGGGSGSEAGGPDRIRLPALVGYHVIAGAMPSSGLTPDRTFKTVNGNDIRVTREGDRIGLVNPAPGRQTQGFGAGGLNLPSTAIIIGPDIIANNGIILPISEVLFP